MFPCSREQSLFGRRLATLQFQSTGHGMTAMATKFPSFAYVGCFTRQKNDGHGEGISVFRIEQSTGAWDLIQTVDTLPSPGFLAVNPQKRILYSAHGDGAQLSTYAIDGAGKLELINR